MIPWHTALPQAQVPTPFPGSQSVTIEGLMLRESAAVNKVIVQQDMR